MSVQSVLIAYVDPHSCELTTLEKFEYLEKPWMRVFERNSSWADKLECLSEATALTIGAVALSKIGLSRVLPALELTAGENLENVAKAAVSVKSFSPERAISHYLVTAGDFAQRLKVAFGKTGEITTNITDSLNEFSHEHLPYVGDLVVQSLSEHPYRVAEAGSKEIFFFGKFENETMGGISFRFGLNQSIKNEHVAAVSAHEYVHVEQRALKARYEAGDSLSADETARMKELIKSHDRLDSVESNFLKTNILERDSANFLSEIIAKSKSDNGIDFTSFYKEVSGTRSSIPANMAGLVKTQLERAALIQPKLADEDLGKNLYRILRGARISAHSRVRMSHKMYEQLFHEREANIFGDAVRKAFKQQAE